jgi:hypothetical protein
MRDGYYAQWRGHEYEASPDGEGLRLYSATPDDGFRQVAPDRYVRVVSESEVVDLHYVRTTCLWHGEPFIVLATHDDWLRVEYTGGRAPVAAALGLEEFDFGVYQGWAPATEVSELREQRV